MSNKSKFTVDDYVRPINPGVHFGKLGRVIGIKDGLPYPVDVVFNHGSQMPYLESELTLADPDVHTVLDQMDAESAPKDPELYSGPVSATVYPTDQMPWAQKKATQGIPAAPFDNDLPNRRAQVLRTAESLVNGQRADDYGPPAENFGRVAAMWSAQFAAKLKEPLTADEIAIALVHLKLSRLANTPDHADSFIDAAGYIALAAEIAEAAQ